MAGHEILEALAVVRAAESGGQGLSKGGQGLSKAKRRHLRTTAGRPVRRRPGCARMADRTDDIALLLTQYAHDPPGVSVTISSDKRMPPNEGSSLTRWGHAGPRAYHPRTPSRCTGMDCNVTTGRLLWENDGRQAPHGDFARTAQGDPPIFAALVREWRASGRTVPDTRGSQGASPGSVGAATTRLQWHPDIPSGPGRWERDGELPPGRETELVTTR
ncbi:hypothetical protein [Streptomyces sp. A30]|uniref:hypothetical protein n=1 Tax=Streptomyces sp. A30 TaxID=2789273 RepID=UPI00397FA920